MEEEKIIVSHREKLLTDSEAYKDAIKNQVFEIKSSAERWAKAVLIVGGTIFLAYTFFRSLIDARKYNENDQLPARTVSVSELNIFQKIMEQIAFFLMAIAREKLMEFLKTYGKTIETDTEQPD
jgi:hypothetical protein